MSFGIRSASSAKQAGRTGFLAALVFSSYLLLTSLFWGTFVADRGLHAETGFIELSQIRPGINGFVYPYDAARKFMSFSFHLAYLLSTGSYFSLHVLFGLWILSTGCLAYVIMRRLAPHSTILAYLVGALSITFGADHGVNWAGYIVQRQTVVFALLAVWLLLCAWERKRPWLLLPAAASQYFSLWTYEACLLILAAVPLLLYRRPFDKKWSAFYACSWSVVPLLRLWMLVHSHWLLHEESYQARVLAKSTSLWLIVRKLGYLMSNGLAFWRWPAYGYDGALGCGTETFKAVVLPVIAGGLLVAATSLLIRHFEHQRPIWPGARPLGAALLALTFLVLAYLPFTLLEAASPLRTQFVSAVPAAIVLIALFSALDSLSRARGALLIAAASVVAGFGLASGLLQQLGLRHDWTGYRKVMKAVVQAAPCLKDDTMVVLVDVPTRMSYSLCPNDAPFDPFRDVLWFNSGLQVLYPHTKLVGIYYRADGSTTDSIRFKFALSGAALDHAGVGVEGDHFDYADMIAFRFDPDRGAVILDSFPEGLAPSPAAPEGYRPQERIGCGVPPAAARHRLDW